MVFHFCAIIILTGPVFYLMNGHPPDFRQQWKPTNKPVGTVGKKKGNCAAGTTSLWVVEIVTSATLIRNVSRFPYLPTEV